MKRCYLTKTCAREVRKAGVGEDALWDSIDRAEAGTIDADLGGGLIKQRVRRNNRGRSSGFRTLLAYRKGKRAIFLHMFAKSSKSNLSELELEAFNELTAYLNGLSEEELDQLVEKRGWVRVEREYG